MFDNTIFNLAIKAERGHVSFYPINCRIHLGGAIKRREVFKENLDLGKIRAQLNRLIEEQLENR